MQLSAACRVTRENAVVILKDTTSMCKLAGVKCSDMAVVVEMATTSHQSGPVPGLANVVVRKDVRGAMHGATTSVLLNSVWQGILIWL